LKLPAFFKRRHILKRVLADAARELPDSFECPLVGPTQGTENADLGSLLFGIPGVLGDLEVGNRDVVGVEAGRFSADTLHLYK
jgi:hypothetical protein